MFSYMLPFCLALEPCDCGDRIRHNNGGNYHSSTWLRVFRDGASWCVVIEDQSTREVFPQDEFEHLTFADGAWEFKPSPYRRDPYTFRYGEARIVETS